MVKLIILAAVGYIFYRALKSWMISGGGRPLDETRRSSTQVDDVLVQDPVCKTYIAQRNSIQLRQDDATLYFCSEQCRDRYRGDRSAEDRD